MGSKFLGSLGRRFKLWWSGEKDKIGGVGILVREDLCMNVVEINKISDRVMVVVIILGNWWWNQDVRKAITEKMKSFWRWKQLSSKENKSCMFLIKKSREGGC